MIRFQEPGGLAFDALAFKADSDMGPAPLHHGTREINFSCNFVPFVVKKVLGFNDRGRKRQSTTKLMKGKEKRRAGATGRFNFM